MKKILTYSLIFSFALGLVLQNQATFGSIIAEQKSVSETLQANLPQVFVQFVQPKSVSNVVVETNPQTALSAQCLFSAVPGKDLVQPTAGLNLNQPANCFDLQIAAPQVRPNLAVTELRQPQTKIVVVVPSAKIQTPSLQNSTPTSQLPVLPLAAAVFSVAVFELKKYLVSKTLKAANSFKVIFSLHQLMVLRC